MSVLLDETSDDSDVDSDSDSEGNVDDAAEVKRRFRVALLLPILDNLYSEHEPKRRRVYNSEAPWQMVQTWSDEVFRRQFRMSKELFFRVVNRCKKAFPGSNKSGFENYLMSQKRAKASSGRFVRIEVKLCVALRMLAGASYLDMVWYGMPLASVHRHFIFMVHLLEKAYPDKEMFDFGPQTDFDTLAGEWQQPVFNIFRTQGFHVCIMFVGTTSNNSCPLVQPIVKKMLLPRFFEARG
jgi:hypothetical protein